MEIICGRWKGRIQMCDTVFLLDYPAGKYAWKGAKSRIGKEREDLPWKETVFDEEFRQWILDFSRDQLPVIYELLKKYKEKKIIVFRAREGSWEIFEESVKMGISFCRLYILSSSRLFGKSECNAVRRDLPRKLSVETGQNPAPKLTRGS